MAIITSKEWDCFLQNHPDAHILQTSAWGQLKSVFGWQPMYMVHQTAGAMILFRSLPGGFHVAYVPKGPIGEGWDSLWPEMELLCKQKRAVFLKIEPDLWEDDGSCFDFSAFTDRQTRTIQPRRTILIDLHGDETSWLERMKQKTRYNIRLAEKKGIEIRTSTDIDLFSKMMEVTGVRDGFGVHSLAYYQRAYDLFHPTGSCELLMAFYNSKPLAGLMVFRHGERAWYLYGASTNEERNRMPTYLLQWETMRWAASQGCTSYDLWGVPDYPEDELEDKFEEGAEGLWGVYRFKRGFGGLIKRSQAAQERVYRPVLYTAYQWLRRNKE